MKFDELKTPCYVVDEGKLEENLKVLDRVRKEAGCHILLAQKAFSCFYEYPLIAKYLDGATASGLYEAELGYEEMAKPYGRENHVFSPGYRPEEIERIDKICDHIIFNSVAQLEKYKDKCVNSSIGLRINPQCSTQGDHAIYDPCAPGSRLGVTFEQFEAFAKRIVGDNIEKIGHKSMADAVAGVIDGIHFHTLCEQNSDDLEITLKVVEEKFGPYLHKLKWINMGGGHHITRDDYDIERLIRLVKHVKETYDVEVYLEPGEAIALNAGYLITTVMDIVDNAGIKVLVLDASAACHMPDVLEMPYRPPLRDSGEAGKKAFTYRLSSCTCLAGDVIGDYSFDREIGIGDRLVFEDMAIYSMVKNNTFNGMALPDIDVMHADGECEVIKSFGYGDFKMRLS